MTHWFPDTCHCECHVETKKILKPCKTHTTFDQVVNHNKSFVAHGNPGLDIAMAKINRGEKTNPAEKVLLAVIIQNQTDKRNEKAKTQFQRK